MLDRYWVIEQDTIVSKHFTLRAALRAVCNGDNRYIESWQGEIITGWRNNG